MPLRFTRMRRRSDATTRVSGAEPVHCLRHHFAVLPQWSATAPRRPNFLLIVADDMGWADVGCYGRDDVRTPAIDSLARDGMKFEHAYANSPVCTPSRVAMITGRYQNRLPIGQEEPLGANDVGLDPDEPVVTCATTRSGLPERRSLASGTSAPSTSTAR